MWDGCACLRALRIGGARRCGRTTGAQLLRVGVRVASRMSVQVDAAADVEPEAAGREGLKVHTATVRLSADGRQAFARRLGVDLRIALRAERVKRADERCTRGGPAVAGQSGTARCLDDGTEAQQARMQRAMQAACEPAATTELLPF